jgi:hypothetical protein
LQNGGDFPARDLFSNEKSGGPGPQRVDRDARLGSTVDRGGVDKGARRCLVGAWRTSGRAPRCSLAMAEEDKPDEAMPEGCSPELERRRRGGAMKVKNGSGLSSG